MSKGIILTSKCQGGREASGPDFRKFRKSLGG